MKTKITSLLLLLLTATICSSTAQPMFGIQGYGAFPLSSFCKEGYRNGGGFGFSFFSNTVINRGKINRAGLHIGINSQFAYSGFEKYTVKLAAPQTGEATYLLNNSSKGVGLAARLLAPGEWFRPYLDVFAGGRFFYTREEITPFIYDPDYESSTTNTLRRTNTATYGFGAGLLSSIGKNVYLDLGFLYSRGSTGKWINLSSARQEGNVVQYNTSRSGTDMLFIRVGITLRLVCSDSCSHSENTNTNYNNNDDDNNNTSFPSPGGLPNRVAPNPPPR